MKKMTFALALLISSVCFAHEANQAKPSTGGNETIAQLLQDYSQAKTDLRNARKDYMSLGTQFIPDSALTPQQVSDRDAALDKIHDLQESVDDLRDQLEEISCPACRAKEEADSRALMISSLLEPMILAQLKTTHENNSQCIKDLQQYRIAHTYSSTEISPFGIPPMMVVGIEDAKWFCENRNNQKKVSQWEASVDKAYQKYIDETPAVPSNTPVKGSGALVGTMPVLLRPEL